jgi:hypothetical protein
MRCNFEGYKQHEANWHGMHSGWSFSNGFQTSFHCTPQVLKATHALRTIGKWLAGVLLIIDPLHTRHSYWVVTCDNRLSIVTQRLILVLQLTGFVWVYFHCHIQLHFYSLFHVTLRDSRTDFTIYIYIYIYECACLLFGTERNGLYDGQCTIKRNAHSRVDRHVTAHTCGQIISLIF